MAEAPRKDKYIIDGEVYSSEYEAEVIEKLLSSAPILLSENLYAVEVRREFRRIACADGAWWQWWRVPAGKYYSWLDCLHDELERHFKKKKLKSVDHKYHWNELKKKDRKKLANKFSKQKEGLVKLVDEMGIEEKHLTLSSLSGGTVESELSVFDLLSTLEKEVLATTDRPSFIEQYIDTEIRGPKAGGTPLEVKVFVKVIARQLVNSFHLEYTPRKLIANISNLKYIESGWILSDKDVSNLTENQDFSSKYPRG